MRNLMPVPMGVRRAKLPALLASSSVAALLMGGGGPAFAACSDYINTTAAGCTNAGTITGLVISNSTVTSQITNTGTIAPNGIVIQNGSVIDGVIQSSGPIAGGISIDKTSSINSVGQAITLFGPSFSGNLSNAGTIAVDGGGGNSGILNESNTFTGSINNTGSINIGLTTPGSSGVGIQVDNSSGTTTFAGGISNGGTIAVNATNGFGSCSSYGIAVLGNQGGSVSRFATRVTNTSSYVTTALRLPKLPSIWTVEKVPLRPPVALRMSYTLPATYCPPVGISVRVPARLALPVTAVMLDVAGEILTM